ncbi:MAG TPA: hypothetical protein DEO34_01650 [Gammaproteobacteria bacterium]|nr:hypothetical protein [Gammaproteobacteria bacterium]
MTGRVCEKICVGIRSFDDHRYMYIRSAMGVKIMKKNVYFMNFDEISSFISEIKMVIHCFKQ